MKVKKRMGCYSNTETNRTTANLGIIVAFLTVAGLTIHHIINQVTQRVPPLLLGMLCTFTASAGSEAVSALRPTVPPAERAESSQTQEAHRPLPLPASGEMFGEKPDGVAPFKIETSGVGHYFVKLVDKATGRQVAAVFIRAGETVKMKMPVGAYEMRYATGKEWHGEKELFGKDTHCSKADSLCEFSRLPNGYAGCAVTLYAVQNGNLSTTAIPASCF